MCFKLAVVTERTHAFFLTQRLAKSARFTLFGFLHILTTRIFHIRVKNVQENIKIHKLGSQLVTWGKHNN